jgi:preprotein translocase subunit YajC
MSRSPPPPKKKQFFFFFFFFFCFFVAAAQRNNRRRDEKMRKMQCATRNCIENKYANATRIVVETHMWFLCSRLRLKCVCLDSINHQICLYLIHNSTTKSKLLQLIFVERCRFFFFCVGCVQETRKKKKKKKKKGLFGGSAKSIITTKFLHNTKDKLEDGKTEYRDANTAFAIAHRLCT